MSSILEAEITLLIEQHGTDAVLKMMAKVLKVRPAVLKAAIRDHAQEES